MPHPTKWTPSTWKQKRLSQIPDYPDQKNLDSVLKRLADYPPLVFAKEADRLKSRLADVSKGEAFLLHGGDCAESFSNLNSNTLRDNFKVLLQMAVILTFTLKKYVVKVGRVAGQFAKPRSSDLETRDELTLPSYRGDIINSFNFHKESRTPDPFRMEQAYFNAAATLNILRAFASGGFADLKQVNAWNLDFAQQSPQGERYQQITSRVSEAVNFMSAVGIDTESNSDIRETEYYTSHEALLLYYEEALTRQESSNEADKWYDLSAHFHWIGDRTRELDGAHVEFLRGVANPIGVKVGNSMSPDELIQLIDVLNPTNEPGRLTLITRLGCNKIDQALPPLIQRVRKEGREVVWCSDPMHGNTKKAANGYKTRNLHDILSEAQKFIEIHESEGTYAGGVHFEMTGGNVVECIGGDQEIKEEHLSSGFYETLCDPRLNANQAIELAFKLA